MAFLLILGNFSSRTALLPANLHELGQNCVCVSARTISWCSKKLRIFGQYLSHWQLFYWKREVIGISSGTVASDSQGHETIVKLLLTQ